LIIAVVLALLAGCSGSEEPAPALSEEGSADTGSLTISWEQLAGALEAGELKNITAFRIRIYSSAPTDLSSAVPEFDSLKIHGCFPATGTEVKIQDLKTGAENFVLYEAYSDKDGDDCASDGECGENGTCHSGTCITCDDLYAIGVRGGIVIEKHSSLQEKAGETECSKDGDCSTVHPDAKCDCAKVDDGNKKTQYCEPETTGYCTVTPPVYIPLYRVGRFNSLPSPSGAIKDKASLVSCQADSECETVHSRAVCDESQGFCTVEGLFPLGPDRPRAFHTATRMSDGKILFTGGFNRIYGGDNFASASPFFEAFNPITTLFQAPGVMDVYSGHNVAMHTTTILDGDSVVVAGGAKEASFRYEQGAELSLVIEVPYEYGFDCTGDDCLNVSDAVMSFTDIMSSAAVQNDALLPSRVFAHAAGLVRKGDVENVLLTGGVNYNDETAAASTSGRYVLCGASDIASGDPAVCASDDTTLLFGPRFSHSDACLVFASDVDSDADQPDFAEACEEYLVFGGVSSELPAAEVFSSGGADVFNKSLLFDEATQLEEVYFPETVRVKSDTPGEPAKLYVFGGVAADDVTEQVLGDRLLVTLRGPQVVPQQVNVNLKQEEEEGVLTVAALDLSELDDAEAVFRFFHTVTVLDNGRIMVAGGLGKNLTAQKSALLFEEPKTHALSYVKNVDLRKQRFGHTATVLTEGVLRGAVLIVGGLAVDNATGTIKFADSAEIFIPEGFSIP
jgi:hypothetical protein